MIYELTIEPIPYDHQLMELELPKLYHIIFKDKPCRMQILTRTINFRKGNSVKIFIEEENEKGDFFYLENIL